MGDRRVNCHLWHGGDGTLNLRGENPEPERVIADAPTAQALLTAIKAEEIAIEESRNQHRHSALAAARQIKQVGE